jgi:hypothetical protein
MNDGHDTVSDHVGSVSVIVCTDQENDNLKENKQKDEEKSSVQMFPIRHRGCQPFKSNNTLSNKQNKSTHKSNTLPFSPLLDSFRMHFSPNTHARLCLPLSLCQHKRDSPIETNKKKILLQI